MAGIRAFISRDSEKRANQVIDRILKRGDQLAAFPFSGRILEQSHRPNLREISEKPYRIVYRVRGQDVEAIDVLHGACRAPRKR
jgi:plasmid stabilization system protein ParE